MQSGNMQFKIIFYDAKQYDRESFENVNKSFQKYKLSLHYVEPRLNNSTVNLAKQFHCVCIFVNDVADTQVMQQLAKLGVKLIALRCAGFNNVDLDAAKKYNIKVVRVPAYSPYGVAEYTIGLMLALNRKIHTAYNRVAKYDFSIDGMVGFTVNGCTVGVIGTGKIGKCAIAILKGMGCTVLANDIFEDSEASKAMGFTYTTLDEIYQKSKIIFLFAPLTDKTRYMINKSSISKMKRGVMIINIGRGQLVNTEALLEGLKSGKIGAAGLDVYENEEKYFFNDMSKEKIDDPKLVELINHENVIVTSHQAFLTDEALYNIADVTLKNIAAFIEKKRLENEVL